MIHLGISQPAMSFPCDIISRYFYEQDIVTEPLPVEGGVAYRIDRPGLGVELDREALSRYRVS
jgi:L-alanine-DL-glutamate epimerase-like enolase superfamily enzyme